jgi:hypothetical protein
VAKDSIGGLSALQHLQVDLANHAHLNCVDYVPCLHSWRELDNAFMWWGHAKLQTRLLSFKCKDFIVSGKPCTQASGILPESWLL